ncbi:MAG: reverse transcriptase domain-containing protein [bacterium]
MKTHTDLYANICSFENLLAAAKQAQRGKRFQENVGRFNANLEYELVGLQRELHDKTYQPGRYREFIIFEPKHRMISAAPYRDRVVHHALCNVIAPLFERTFIFDSYANRTGKGTHRAILRYQQFCRKNAYALKCDVRKYFPSLDHEILKAEIRRTIACPDTLWLINRIIDGSNVQEPFFEYFSGDDLFTPFERRKGLPIGNLTSQFFANVYLNRTRRRLRRLQTQYAAGNFSWADVDRAVQGWLGHAGFGNTYRLREKLFESHPFQKTA